MRMIITAYLLLLPFSCISVPGCAGERAAEVIARDSGEVMTMLVKTASEKLDSIMIESEGRLQNPHYRLTAGWFTGVMLDLGLDGLYLELRAEGDTAASLPAGSE